MGNITPKEAIANLNHLYGMVSPDMQRSLDVAIKALERTPRTNTLLAIYWRCERWCGMTEENHEYKCEDCRHKDKCVRVSAFLTANVRPYSDGCENFEKGGTE